MEKRIGRQTEFEEVDEKKDAAANCGVGAGQQVTRTKTTPPSNRVVVLLLSRVLKPTRGFEV
jgi:hypothetical protein